MGCACGGNSSPEGARRNQRGQQQPRQIVINQSSRAPVQNIQEAQRQSGEEERKSICTILLSFDSTNIRK